MRRLNRNRLFESAVDVTATINISPETCDGFNEGDVLASEMFSEGDDEIIDLIDICDVVVIDEIIGNNVYKVSATVSNIQAANQLYQWIYDNTNVQSDEDIESYVAPGLPGLIGNDIDMYESKTTTKSKSVKRINEELYFGNEPSLFNLEYNPTKTQEYAELLNQVANDGEPDILMFHGIELPGSYENVFFVYYPNDDDYDCDYEICYDTLGDSLPSANYIGTGNEMPAVNELMNFLTDCGFMGEQSELPPFIIAVNKSKAMQLANEMNNSIDTSGIVAIVNDGTLFASTAVVGTNIIEDACEFLQATIQAKNNMNESVMDNEPLGVSFGDKLVNTPIFKYAVRSIWYDTEPISPKIAESFSPTEMNEVVRRILINFPKGHRLSIDLPMLKVQLMNFVRFIVNCANLSNDRNRVIQAGYCTLATMLMTPPFKIDLSNTQEFDDVVNFVYNELNSSEPASSYNESVSSKFGKYRKLYEAAMNESDMLNEKGEDEEGADDDFSDIFGDDNGDSSSDNGKEKDDNTEDSNEEPDNGEGEYENVPMTAVLLTVKKDDADKCKDEMTEAGIPEEDIEILDADEDDENVKIKVDANSVKELKDYLSGKGIDLEEKIGGKIIDSDDEESNDSEKEDDGKEDDSDKEGSEDDLANMDFGDLFGDDEESADDDQK